MYVSLLIKSLLSLLRAISADVAAASAIARAAIPSDNETGMGVSVFTAVTNAAHSFDKQTYISPKKKYSGFELSTPISVDFTIQFSTIF